MNIHAAPPRASHDLASLTAQVARVEALIQTGALDEARRLAKDCASVAPADWQGINALLQALFQLGEFKAAFELTRHAVKSGMADVNSMRNLSAIYAAAGKEDSASKWLGHSCRIQPVSVLKAPANSRASLMCLEAANGHSYSINQNRDTGLYQRRFGKSHFSTRAFLNFEDVTVLNGLVHGENFRAYQSIPGVDLVINTIGCPERQADALLEVAAFLDKDPSVPVINHPSTVLRTSRAENAKRLSKIDGLLFPKTHAFKVDAPANVLVNDLEQQGMGYPLIVREFGSQTGRSLRKHDNRADLLQRLEGEPDGMELYAIQYHDCRGPSGFHHKSRVFFVDGVMYPVASLSNDDWQIHSNDRYRVMPDNPATQEREQAYLRDPVGFLGADNVERLHAVRDVVGLDFFGIDLTVLEDGQLIIFEANSLMRHNFDHADAFPYTRPYLERVSRAFDAMVEKRIGLAPRTLQ